MLVIKNGKIVTMTGEVYECGSVLAEEGKIVYVGENPRYEEKEDTVVIDATGLWVMPGLIEAHCHIGITEEKEGEEDDDCNETTQPVTPYLRGMDAVNPMDPAFHNAIQAGITSVMVGPGSSNVVGGQFLFIKTQGRVIEEMIVKEPAAMKIAFGENPKRSYKDLNKPPASRMSIAAMLRAELFKASCYKKKKEQSEADMEEDFKLESWLPVLNQDIPLKAHVHRADDILTAIRIAKEYHLKLTLDHCSEGHLIAEEIYKSGYPAIVGPGMSCRNKLEIKNVDFKTPGVLARNGVKVAITTDHPVTLIQYLPICAGLAAKKGLGIEEGLKSITINAAEICQVEDRVGSLEVGKDADIAIFTGNPMEVFTHTMYTIIDGKIIYEWKDELEDGKN